MRYLPVLFDNLETTLSAAANDVILFDGTGGYATSGIPRAVSIKVIDDATALTTGDGKARLVIPEELNGYVIATVGVHVYTASSSGAVTIQIHNETDAVDVCSTPPTVDQGEVDSATAATAAVINTSNDDVATADVIRFDCDGAGTGTLGCEIRIGFRKP